MEDRARDRGRAAVVTLVVEEGVELSRWTTIGTGGRARGFAQPATVAELEEALRLAAAEGLGVVVIGLGSNVLAADAGVDALVLRLTGSWRRSAPTAGCCSRAAAPRTRCACMPPATQGSAASSSRARSRGRQAGVCA